MIRYDQWNGTKKTPKASKCIIANGVTPINEMRAPFGRGIDSDRAAVAMPRSSSEFRRHDALLTERFASGTSSKLSSTISFLSVRGV